MQLVWMVTAGGMLAGAYLATLHALLFGRDGERTSLLITMVCFIASSGVALGVMVALAGGSVERFTAALAGFVAARAMLGRPLLGPWDDEGPGVPAGAGGTATPAAAGPSRVASRARTAS